MLIQKWKWGFFSAFNQYLISTQLALHNRSWPKLAVREPSRGVLGLCVIIYRRVNRTAHEVDREGVFEQTSSYPAKTLTAAGGAHRGDCIPCALQNVVPSPEAWAWAGINNWPTNYFTACSESLQQTIFFGKSVCMQVCGTWCVQTDNTTCYVFSCNFFCLLMFSILTFISLFFFLIFFLSFQLYLHCIYIFYFLFFLFLF